MKVVVCDRCGKFIPDGEQAVCFTSSTAFRNDYDLCAKCHIELDKWIGKSGMKVVVCDRCGKVIPDGERVVCFTSSTAFRNDYDLCAKCHIELDKWIEKGKENEE